MPTAIKTDCIAIAFIFYFVDRSNNDDIGAFFQYSNVNEGYVRTVYAIKEFKWVFYEHGLPAYFEDLNNYKARRIKDRLNSRIIINYLEKQGVTRIVCTDTAELIEVDELRRVHGILDGLVRRNNWEGRAE